MRSLPKLSIAAKLYVIFALVAAGTAGLAACAVINSHHNAALAVKAGAAFQGALNVERVDGPKGGEITNWGGGTNFGQP